MSLTTREITITNQGVLTCNQMDGKIPEILFLYNNTSLKALYDTMKCLKNTQSGAVCKTSEFHYQKLFTVKLNRKAKNTC